MSLSEKLIAAAKRGSTREVRKLLGRGALFIKDQFGNTALHEAAWNGNTDIVKILLNAFCFVDSINNSGFTPLHLGSQNGHVKVVKTLVKWKADPTLCNQHGETALHLVAKYDHAGIIALFSAFKVPMNAKGKDDNTALHIAAKLGNTSTVKALLNAGADPMPINALGALPIDYAIEGGYKDAIKLLESAAKKSKSRSRASSVIGRTAHSTSPDVDALNSCKDQHRNLQRSMSTSGRLSVRPMRDARAAVNKKYMRGDPIDRPTSSKAQPGMTSRPLGSTDLASFSANCVDLDDGGARYPPLKRRDKNASIEQLLNEIERECGGPDYKYVSRDFSMSPSQDDTGSIGSGGSGARVSAKRNLRSTQNGEISKDNYDILTPPDSTDTFLPSSTAHPFSQVIALPPALSPPPVPTSKRPSALSPPPVPTSKRPSALSLPRKAKYHHYETLSPTLPSLPGEVGDTYVFMAPRNDFNRSCSMPEPALQSALGISSNSTESSSTSKSKGSKRAIVFSPAVEADTRHEPNSKLEPAKGILAQPSNDINKTQLDRYLQDELETMQKAFQIRLSQLEKRYQRQLVLEQKRNAAEAVAPAHIQLRRNVNPLCPPHPLTTQRRLSWHSDLPASQAMDEMVDSEENRAGSSLGIDSDTSAGESDAEYEAGQRGVRLDNYNNEGAEATRNIPGVLRNVRPSAHDLPPPPPPHHSTPQAKEGLKGGARSWQDSDQSTSPTMSPIKGFCEDEDESLTEEAKGLIQERIKEYREKMMEYFKEKSEARIACIEKKYQSHMSEVERQCEAKASQKLGQLENRIKDLEHMLEVQTMV